MRIIATIEARMTSTRLPGKVLKDLKTNISLLEFLILNVKRSKLLTDIIVATTVNSTDDPIVSVADKCNVSHFRGSEHNVLKRVSDAHRIADSDISVLLTGDNPLVTGEMVDYSLKQFLKSSADFGTNSGPNRKIPDGLDIVITKSSLLRESLELANTDEDFEHVCNIINKDKSIHKIEILPECDSEVAPNISVTVDTLEDYEYVKSLALRLSNIYTISDIVKNTNGDE